MNTLGLLTAKESVSTAKGNWQSRVFIFFYNQINLLYDMEGFFSAFLLIVSYVLYHGAVATVLYHRTDLVVLFS